MDLGLDVIAITDHERIDAAVAGRAIARGPRPAARGHRRRGGHDPRRPPAGAGPDRPVKSYRSMRTTIAEIHDQGGLAIPAHPLVPYPLCAQARTLRGLLDAGDPAVRPDALETFNPDLARTAAPPDRRPLRGRPRPRPGRQQRRPRPRRRRASAGPRSRAAPRPTCARRSPPARPATTARSTRPSGQLGTFRDQLRKRGRDARDEALGRVRKDGTGRDHGYPGGRQRPPRYDAGDRGAP